MKILVALLAVAFVAHVNAFDESIVPEFARTIVEKCCKDNNIDINTALGECVMLSDENIPLCSPIIACIFSGLDLVDASYVIEPNKLGAMLQEQAKLMSIDVDMDTLTKAIESCLQRHNPATAGDKNTELAKFFQCVTKEAIFL